VPFFLLGKFHMGYTFDTSPNLGETDTAEPHAAGFQIYTPDAIPLGENVSDGGQPLDTELTAIAAVTSAADKLPYFTGSGAAAVASFTAAGRALVDDADAAAQLVTLGLGVPTGTGNVVRATSPTLVTPVIGVASGTSLALITSATVAKAGSNTFQVGPHFTLTNASSQSWSMQFGASLEWQLWMQTSGTPYKVLSANGSSGDLTNHIGGLVLTGIADLSNAAAGQVKFPATQNASSNANTLDDYEEGTFVPTANSLTVVGTPTYAGTYTKIGNRVHWEIRVTSTTTTASTAGTTSFSGMPFTVGKANTCAAVSVSTKLHLGLGLAEEGAAVVWPATWGADADVVLSGSYRV
jgi:hypothetical protein